MDLLMNGCSYTAIWQPSEKFTNALGCDKVNNIALYGGSFQRVCRTTVEYFAKNPKPNFVLIPITFCYRWELSVGNKNDDMEGNWLPMRTNNDLKQEQMAQEVSKEKIDDLVDNYYGCIPNDINYIDKMFTDIIMLSSFLEKQEVPYLMFDMCNGFDREDLKNFKGMDKLSLIESNKNIVDLFTFCGNRYMWSQLTNAQQKKADKTTHHHASFTYHILEKHIIQTFL